MKIILTGASKGIGRGIATVLAEAGHELGLLARSRPLLETLKQQITDNAGHAEIADCDLRDPEAAEAAIHQLIAKLGGVDALINNAGLVIRKPADEISLDEWHAMVETNLNGLFYATRSVLRFLKAQGSGHIVNLSSISGVVPLPGGSGYAATKYAVTGFSESLFQEVRSSGIKVTTVFPGSVDSASHRHDPEEDTSWKIRPEEVGQAIADLLETRPQNVISRLEIRPIGRPAK